jgi:hypothetical protein
VLVIGWARYSLSLGGEDRPDLGCWVLALGLFDGMAISGDSEAERSESLREVFRTSGFLLEGIHSGSVSKGQGTGVVDW